MVQNATQEANNNENPRAIKGTNDDESVNVNVNNFSDVSYPEDRYDQSTATAGSAADEDTFGELTDQDLYEGLIFMNTTGNVTVQISLDGATWIAVDHSFIDYGVAARTIVAGTDGNAGPFLMNTPCRGVRFLNEGAVAATVMYSQIGKVAI